MDKDAVSEDICTYIESMEEKDRWITVYTTVADTGKTPSGSSKKEVSSKSKYDR